MVKKRKKWTVLRGNVCKIRRNYTIFRICPRVYFLSRRNKYSYFNNIGIGDLYKFINKSHYDFRC